MNNLIPLIRNSRGYNISGTHIHIDPLEPVETAIISHAHGDHAIPGHDVVYCSINTAKLLRARYQNFANKIFTFNWNDLFKIEHINFKLIPAGHMLGSSQIYWEQNNRRIIYTGDFKLQQDKTCEPFEIAECDVLITESTFGDPNQKHPDDEIVMEQLKLKTDINFIIAAYNLGKSQRLTRLFNDYLPERKIMIHNKAAKYHHLYKEAGFDPGIWTPYQRKVFKYNTNCVYIIPPTILSNFPPSPSYLRGMASGWEKHQQGLELNIPISDHADWNDLITTIIKSKAKEVFTIHGNGNLLKKHFINSSININELPE